MDVDVYVDAHVIMVFDFDLRFKCYYYLDIQCSSQSSQSRFNSHMSSLYVRQHFYLGIKQKDTQQSSQVCNTAQHESIKE